jgi:alpha-L-arabinofuranosidase
MLDLGWRLCFRLCLLGVAQFRVFPFSAKRKVLALFMIVIVAVVIVPMLLEYVYRPGGETPSGETELVQVTVSSSLYLGQSPDMRVGLEIPETSTRYSSSPNMNFLGTYGFEAYQNTTYGEMAIDWLLWSDGDWPAGNTTSTVAFSKDGTPGNYMHGKYAQKITVTSFSEPARLGQYQSGRMFLANRTYKFGCWMKQSGLTEDVRLRVRFWSGDTDIDQYQSFTVGTEWAYYEMEFVIPINYTPIDPYYGQASSERIEVFSTGTLWIDDAQFYDSEGINAWGLSTLFIEEVRKLRPSTLRYGGLGCNSLKPENIFGDRFDLQNYESWAGSVGGDVFDFNQFLKLCELTGANPEYVLSQCLIMDPSLILNLLEYMYGDNTTTYGAMREKAGFESWNGKFDKVYFELGNEVLLNGNGPTWTPEQYADYVIDAVRAAKSSPYWNSSVNKIGVGLWYTDVGFNVPLLNNLEGVDIDFMLAAEYFPGHEFTNYYYSWLFVNQANYDEESLTGSAEKRAVWYRQALGEAAYIDEYAAYLKEMASENYLNTIDTGIYEYGVTGVFKREPYNHELANMETSLGAAIAILDQSLSLRKNGMNPINAFYVQGFGWTWGFMDDYPYIRKRPVYYAMQMYGEFQRGRLLNCSFSSDVFNPFGDAANTHIMWDSYASFTYYKLQLHYYPTNVPILAVYPFIYNDRYLYLLINRGLEKSVKVQLNLPYTPSNRSLIITLTGDDPYLYNEDSQENTVHLNYTIVNDFTNNYTITLSPHSAYVIVNYVEGAKVCLDEDGDGYGANIYELENCSASKILVDPDDLDPNIHP